MKSGIVEGERTLEGFGPASDQPDPEQTEPVPQSPSGTGQIIKVVLGLFSLGLILAAALLMRSPRDDEVVKPNKPNPSIGMESSQDPDKVEGVSGRPIDPRTGKALSGVSQQGITPDPDANKAFGALKFEVKVIPECGEIGRPMRAEILTTPGAAITLAVVYKDGQSYGQWGTFRADIAGRLIYPWTVPTAAPEGLARFLAGGSDESRKESAAGYWNFTVAPVGAC